MFASPWRKAYSNSATAPFAISANTATTHEDWRSGEVERLPGGDYPVLRTNGIAAGAERQIAELQALHQAMLRLRSRCDSRGHAGACEILKELAVAP
jgi:hypothetical protein